MALLNMNTRGLISSRSEVVAILSGELLELKKETSYLFKTQLSWEPHYFLLTTIGILKFPEANIEKTPHLIPLRNIVRAYQVDNEAPSEGTLDRSLKIVHVRSERPEKQLSLVLSTESRVQITEWEDTIKRLQILYNSSHSALGKADNRRSSIHPSALPKNRRTVEDR